jgi:hypothetical protein
VLWVVTVKFHVPAGTFIPTSPAVLHPYPLRDVVLGASCRVEAEVRGLMTYVPTPATPAAIEIEVLVLDPPGSTVVRCL